MYILEYLGMENVGIFYSQLVYFVAIWFIAPVLVCCTETNLATLLSKVKLSWIGFPHQNV
jgi:hypothetical protein